MKGQETWRREERREKSGRVGVRRGGWGCKGARADDEREEVEEEEEKMDDEVT